MRVQKIIEEVLHRFFSAINKKKPLVLTLSVVVVFVTTYMLILPALTLDKDSAKDEGGIDLQVVSEEQTSGDEEDLSTMQKESRDTASGEITFDDKNIRCLSILTARQNSHREQNLM